jgi:hypothetical protein
MSKKMIANVDGFYIAAEIRLTRQVHKGSILIVEGQTDEKVLGRFIDLKKCQIQIAFGKKNALEALDYLEDEGFPGIVTLVDADFDRVLGIKYSQENLILTDAHDLDLTIFLSEAFKTYLEEYGNSDLINKNFKNDHSLIRKAIIEATLPLAYCRLTAQKNNLRLKFKELDHDTFVQKNTLLINESKMLSDIISASKTSISQNSLKAYLMHEQSTQADTSQITNGHDVAAFFGIALRALIGTRRDVHTWASEIEAGLRIAFDHSALTATNFFKELLSWESKNSPYKIF